MTEERVVLVGERMNQATWRPKCWPDVWCRRYWDVMVRLGAFRDSRSRAKLESLGLRWDLAVNFLPPDPQLVPWDAARAREVASAWLPRLQEEFSLVLLAGKRVVDAFGAELLGTMAECCGSTVDLGGVGGVMLPHPSGLSRWWNDPANVEEFRRRTGAEVQV